MTDSALVSVSFDPGLAGTAGTFDAITVDTAVDLFAEVSLQDWEMLVDRHESMSGVKTGGITNTRRTIIEVWAAQTLVTDTNDLLGRC